MRYGSQVAIGPSLTPTVKIIIIANCAIFVLQLIFGSTVIRWFGLTPALVLFGLHIWQPFTYLFLHAGLGHLLFNMLGLWMFGSDLERHWGSNRFLRFFFFTGAGAGVLSVLVHPSSTVPTIGASGAVYGILMAFALLFPDRIIFLAFLPPIRVKYLVMIMGFIAFVMAIGQSGTPIDHIAHLGGMAFAFLYVKGWVSPVGIRESIFRWRLKRLQRRFKVYEGQRENPRPRTSSRPRNRRDGDFWIN